MSTAVAQRGEEDSRRAAWRETLVGWTMVVLVAALAIFAGGPPRAKGADAPVTEFSAMRAMRHVEEIAREPHALGTPAHEQARAAIVTALRAMGVAPIEEPQVAVAGGGSYYVAGRVTNVIARVPGTANTGAIVLTAHYDSEDRAPGAGDDAGGVAAAMETLRAVLAGPKLRNDVVLLLTDGEEAGLLGAQAAAVHDAWLRDTALMVNLEGRGDRGPAMMFETSPGNDRLIRELAQAAPYVSASSLMYTVYQKMPNDTDYSVFRKLGTPGYNIAFGGHVEAYHSRLDTPTNLSADSLQHDGSYALALVRHFGDMDLQTAGLRGGDDAVYFNPIGHWLAHYPQRWAMPLQVVLLAFAIATILVALLRRRLALMPMLCGAAAALALVIMLAMAGAVAFLLINAGIGRDRPFGDVPASYLLLVALVLLTTTVAVAAAALLPRLTRAWVSHEDLAYGGVLMFALLGIAAARTLPGASYLLLWPTAAALPQLWRDNRSTRWLPMMVALVLYAPLGQMLFVFLFWSLPTALALGALIGVTVVLAAPAWWGMNRLPKAMATALLATAVACLAAGLALARPNATHPHPDTLSFAQDADGRQAAWYSYAAPDAWTQRYLTAGAAHGPLPSLLGGLTSSVYSHPAPPRRLAGPTAEISGSDAPNRQMLRLVLRSPRRAPGLRLVFENPVRVKALRVNGEPLPAQRWDKAGDGGAPVIDLYGFGDAPVEVALQLEGDPGCRVWLSDRSYDLPEAATRPAERLAWYGSDLIVITRALHLC